MEKSEIVRKFCYRLQNDYRYIFWMDADTETTLQSSFLYAARALELPMCEFERKKKKKKKKKIWPIPYFFFFSREGKHKKIHFFEVTARNGSYALFPSLDNPD